MTIEHDHVEADVITASTVHGLGKQLNEYIAWVTSARGVPIKVDLSKIQDIKGDPICTVVVYIKLKEDDQ